MLPPQLERLVAALESDPGVGLAFSDYEVIDDQGNPLQDPSWRANDRPDGSANVRLPHEVTITNLHDTGDNFIGASFLYRAEVAAVVGPYDDSAFGGEDYDYWLRMHLVTNFRHVDESLYCYRVHDNTLTARAGELDLSANIGGVRYLDCERRGSLLADGATPSSGTAWRDPAQYVAGASGPERVLYSALDTDDATAHGSGRVRVVVIDVPLRAIDPACLRNFDIAVVQNAATYCWLRQQSFDPGFRLLYGEPAELAAAITHAAALRDFERRTASVGKQSASWQPATPKGTTLPRHALLLLDHWRVGGLEQMVLTLARELSRCGVRTTIGLAAEAVTREPYGGHADRDGRRPLGGVELRE